MSDAPETICPNRFEIQLEAPSISIPCCWNFPIDQPARPNKEINRVVIVVHGVVRNADEYYLNTMAAAKKGGVEETTLVIAPQFLIEADLTTFELTNDIPFWSGESGEGWKKGDDSISTENHPREAFVSSFEVVDQIVERVTTSKLFPKLDTVVIVGHSAGGQYVNRYAVGTQIGQRLPQGIHLRFVVANPSTYVYLNQDRRVAGTTKEFAIPAEAEPGYNDYKYGLDNLNRYMSRATSQKLRQDFAGKEVVYLLGGEDTQEAYLEQTPNAMLQGANRLERGQIYYHYLRHYYGEEITRTHKIALIPCVGHDHAAIFRSEAGLKYLFDVQ